MLLANKWLYLDLEKTGCSFLRKKLLTIYGPQYFLHTVKHSEMNDFIDLPKIMTIRDPFAYYLSLWSYGLDKRGAFYQSVCTYFPDVATKMYSGPTREAFSYFLDFSLELPSRLPNSPYSIKKISSHLMNKFFPKAYFGKSDLDLWIPLSVDVYTARILRLIVPVSSRLTFSRNLSADLSISMLQKYLSPYVPDVLIRTESLNSDFYFYADHGFFNFMDLPFNWKKLFPIDSGKINFSSTSSKLSLSFYSDYHRSLLRAKSTLSYYLLSLVDSKIISTPSAKLI